MTLPAHNPAAQIPADADPLDSQTLATILYDYKNEAKQARDGGPSPRDKVWKANWNRYWGRYDHSQKADWQSKFVMPESPQFVDRWAAAMREALDAGGEWFTVTDDTGSDASKALMPHIMKLMRIILGKCSWTPDGHRADFSSVFEDQMKLGALMACCASVTWKDDEKGGWPTVESVDPREVWLDPKLRHKYRLRTYYVDKYELVALANKLDDEGRPLYDVDQIMAASASHDEELRMEKERSAGHSRGDGNARSEVQIDEWLCDVLSPTGEVVHANSLVIVANDRWIIRGPEENPFWHQQDWIVHTAMIPVPFSAYGRSYMEDWADVADAFIEMTNLILDGTFTSAMKAFAALPEMLENPTDLEEGISPNKIFRLAEGLPNVKEFIKEIDLGTLPPEAINVWGALKQELREGAKLSEIALGQLAPNQGTTATEINTVTQSGSAMIRSMARTIESRFLEPVLTMLWQVALQHMDFTALAPQIGEATAAMLTQRRDEFRDLKITFRVRGISGLIDRQMQLRNLLSMLQIVGQNELLLRALLQRASPDKILNQLFHLFGVDPNELAPTQQERTLASLVAPQAQPAAAPGAAR